MVPAATAHTAKHHPSWGVSHMAGDALVVGVIAVLVIVVLCVLISAGRDVGRAVGLLPKPQQRRTGSRKRKSSSSSPYGS